jgi:sugar/nucleoside kinase (ribokinase family)
VTAARLRPRRLVLIGSVLVDVLLYVDHLPERGGDTVARRTLLTTGGGFNVLAGSARLGMAAAYAGRVGDGPMGTQIMSDLDAAGIALLLPRVRERDNGFDIGIVEPDAERTFVTAPGVEAELEPEHLRAIPLRAGDAIYTSGYDLCYPLTGASLEGWLPALPSRNLLVCDPGPLVAEIPARRLERVLARSDIISLNTREIAILTGTAEIPEAARRLLPRLASGAYVVARAAQEGCWLASATLAPTHLPARPTQAVDSTGAGDTHVAALLAVLARGENMLTAAAVANIAASISVERAGPATGPTAAELETALANTSI